MFETMRKLARETIALALENGYEDYLSDFHHNIFNMKGLYVDDNTAKSDLEEMGVFDAIAYIVKYENIAFDEVATDLTSPRDVGNMLWYIIGEEELYSMFDGCFSFDEFWNEEIGENECQILLQWLKDNDRI